MYIDYNLDFMAEGFIMTNNCQKVCTSLNNKHL